MIAVSLSPKARALIVAHRDEPRPTAADRERVTAALRARLGSAVLPLEAPLPERLTRAGWQRVSASALGVCAVGSVLLLARRPAALPPTSSQLENKPMQAAYSAPAVIVPSQPVVPSEAPTVAPPMQQPLAARQHAPLKGASASPADTLAQEVRLLSSATSQLGAGQAAAALVALDEHLRRFPSGALREERNAAKARALCMLHRFSEGRAALALLAAGSPIASRAKEECDLSSARAESASFSQKSERN